MKFMFEFFSDLFHNSKLWRGNLFWSFRKKNVLRLCVLYNFVCYMMHIWFCVLCVDLCYVASMSLVGVGQCWAGITNPLGITCASWFNHFKVSPWMMPWLKTGLPIFTCVKIGCENLVLNKKKTKMENQVRSNLLPRSRS
jgi:hypothetical protein